jgi:NTP pyrophosphatase (non-canonical NTP hydrolase)
MSSGRIDEVRDRLRRFAKARDWERFHTPKNLAMALAVEAAELLEIFQWLTPEESSSVMSDPQLAAEVRDELADVMIYLVRLGDVLDIELLSVAHEKITTNETRFPPAVSD